MRPMSTLERWWEAGCFGKERGKGNEPSQSVALRFLRKAEQSFESEMWQLPEMAWRDGEYCSISLKCAPNGNLIFLRFNFQTSAPTFVREIRWLTSQ
mmetsp:Transcript_33094/g.63571  ORF Transcript_33094/g.63571 Transcript_33094/m.63571 type:complete len:97 (-) Transcript_33094:527-817(-)